MLLVGRHPVGRRGRGDPGGHGPGDRTGVAGRPHPQVVLAHQARRGGVGDHAVGVGLRGRIRGCRGVRRGGRGGGRTGQRGDLGDRQQAVGLGGLGLVGGGDHEPDELGAGRGREDDPLLVPGVPQGAGGHQLVDVRGVLAHVDLVVPDAPVGLGGPAGDRQPGDAGGLHGRGVVPLVEGHEDLGGVRGRVDPVLVVEGGRVPVDHVADRVAGVGLRRADRQGARVGAQPVTGRGSAP